MFTDYDAYERRCSYMLDEGLQREYNKQWKLTGASMSGLQIGGSLAPVTMGLSLFGAALSGAGMRRAYKKVTILERLCNERGFEPQMRARDILGGQVLGGARGIAPLAVSLVH
jgi:hypothetical protein